MVTYLVTRVLHVLHKHSPGFQILVGDAGDLILATGREQRKCDHTGRVNLVACGGIPKPAKGCELALGGHALSLAGLGYQLEFFGREEGVLHHGRIELDPKAERAVVKMV